MGRCLSVIIGAMSASTPPKPQGAPATSAEELPAGFRQHPAEAALKVIGNLDKAFVQMGGSIAAEINNAVAAVLQEVRASRPLCALRDVDDQVGPCCTPLSPPVVMVASGALGLAITPAAELSSKLSAPATVRHWQTLTYIIKITDTGPSAAWQAALIDHLPAGTAFRTATTASPSVVMGSQSRPPRTRASAQLPG